MDTPAELRYSSDHEWIRVEESKVRVGITDFAQDNLGDVVFVQIPEVGAVVKSGDSFSEVESTKSVSDIYAPVDGTVVEVNELLESQPELLNSDPYGDGWICVIEISDPTQVDGLLDAAGYQALTGD
ncbi:MAG TPA: glycine cleavage system protein GcvH [Microthrixaceae bacterium]|nr:glycine cleavage system protein GcvH [Microthrixaceae bacterium]HNI34324.1 glycine cleavage system protein GcvH [Microthrixaceae bacterium]